MSSLDVPRFGRAGVSEALGSGEYTYAEIKDGMLRRIDELRAGVGKGTLVSDRSESVGLSL